VDKSKTETLLMNVTKGRESDAATSNIPKGGWGIRENWSLGVFQSDRWKKTGTRSRYWGRG